jgi:uncharacterized membrane protein
MSFTFHGEDGVRGIIAFFAAILWVVTLIFVIVSFASWRLTGAWLNPLWYQVLPIPDIQSSLARPVLNWLATCRIINSSLTASLIFSWLATRR